MKEFFLKINYSKFVLLKVEEKNDFLKFLK